MNKFIAFSKWVTWSLVFFILGWGTRFIPEFDFGQAESQQTINNDLVRRVKMLEWNENKWEYNDMILLQEILKNKQLKPSRASSDLST